MIVTHLSLKYHLNMMDRKKCSCHQNVYVYVVREKPEVFAILTSSLVIICRESIKREKERERESVCGFVSRGHISLVNPPLRFFAGRAFTR